MHVGDLKYQRTIIGYHGCDELVAKGVLLKGKQLKHSKNDYDWLGRGFTFGNMVLSAHMIGLDSLKK
jgi:hypothetical protein